jgi:ABC-type branched-subunit amino acid transport system substrate-binding protein
LGRHHAVRRWALIGNDYIWPHAVHRQARRAVAATGGHTVLDRRVPLGGVAVGMDRLLDDLRGARPDALLLSLVGRDLARFNAGLRQAGLDRRLVRLSGALEENGLLAVGGDRTGLLYAAMPSFESLSDDRHLGLAERHRDLFGPRAPVLDAYAEGVYDGIRLVAALAGEGSLRPRLLGPAVARAVVRSGGASPRVHLARADGLGFDIVA